jgi:uncharacterized protein DUF3617
MPNVPKPDASKRCMSVKPSGAIAAIAALGWLLVPTAIADASDWPRFRKGVWQFERTMAAGHSGDVLFKREMTRCVDPSESMKETFRALSVGNCRASPPERHSNKYVFARRCDYMGPVRTTIVVQSDTAYTEINELQRGASPLTDTVVARRISECN